MIRVKLKQEGSENCEWKNFEAWKKRALQALQGGFRIKAVTLSDRDV